MQIIEAGSRTKLIDADSNAWYRLLLLTVLADTGREDGGVLRWLLELLMVTLTL